MPKTMPNCRPNVRRLLKRPLIRQCRNRSIKAQLMTNDEDDDDDDIHCQSGPG